MLEEVLSELLARLGGSLACAKLLMWHYVLPVLLCI